MIIPHRLGSFTDLPTDALVSAKELSLLASRSRASLWRDVREGRLPQPVSIGTQTRRWRIEDVRAYLKGAGA